MHLGCRFSANWEIFICHLLWAQANSLTFQSRREAERWACQSRWGTLTKHIKNLKPKILLRSDAFPFPEFILGKNLSRRECMHGIVICIIEQNNKSVVEDKREDLDTKRPGSVLVLSTVLTRWSPKALFWVGHKTQLFHPFACVWRTQHHTSQVLAQSCSSLFYSQELEN